MKERGWKEADFVYVIGDAYVDHSSFGPAIISRVLEAHGYKVAIVSWKPQAIRLLLSPSLTSVIRRVSQHLESHVWDFWCQRAIWIPW